MREIDMNITFLRLAVVKAMAIFAIFYLIFALILPSHALGGLAAGYFLGLLAVLLHFGMSVLSRYISDELFLRYFFTGLVVRFVTVLALFLLFIILEKFDQLSFTVSFLISYIFHSVIDTILLNQKLTDQAG